MVDVQDTLCKAFIMSLGSAMPERDIVDHMARFVKTHASVEGEALTEDFVYSMIPQYINFIFNNWKSEI